ncbi:MAG: GNAT family N-acetyltransferase [Thermomicrobiales bacterium]|nr:GNAT family N-acetyltransferase [Thermomicrobiales bacterium]MCO5223278.1 GNAT family N-acetyltransferase [Thermomicrobiales bacterium]
MTSIRVEKLTRHHQVEDFACGQEPLDRFLIQHALQSQLANASQTYLAIGEDAVVGYYTLVVGETGYEDAPERLLKGIARHPIPLMILARLAVVTNYQGRRIGEGLIKDAMQRTVAAADIAGIRALAVHAKDDDARRYYERFSFESSPLDPLLLYMLIKDVRRSIQESSA